MTPGEKCVLMLYTVASLPFESSVRTANLIRKPEQQDVTHLRGGRKVIRHPMALSCPQNGYLLECYALHADARELATATVVPIARRGDVALSVEFDVPSEPAQVLALAVRAGMIRLDVVSRNFYASPAWCDNGIGGSVTRRAAALVPDDHTPPEAGTPLAGPQSLEGPLLAPSCVAPLRPADHTNTPTDRRPDSNIYESPCEILARIAGPSQGLHKTSSGTFESWSTSALVSEVSDEDAGDGSLPASGIPTKPIRAATDKTRIRTVSRALVIELLAPSAVARCDAELTRVKAEALTVVGDGYIHTSFEACRDDLHTIVVGGNGPLPPGVVARCARLMNARAEQLLDSDAEVGVSL